MSEENIRKVFSKNLKRYLEINEKQPADLVRDLKIPFSTVSNWINGYKMPRMGNVELLARYFRVEKSDLLEDKQVSLSDGIESIEEKLRIAYGMQLLSLSEQDMELLRVYRILNATGKSEALKRLTELSEIPRYREDMKLSENKAI